MHDKHFITINKYAMMLNIHACVCWFHISFSSSIFSQLINCSPPPIYIYIHISMLHKISGQYNNDYSGTSPKGKSYPVSFGTHTQGQTNPMFLGTKTQGQDQPHTPTSECLPRGLQGLLAKDPQSHINNISKDNACSIT